MVEATPSLPVRGFDEYLKDDKQVGSREMLIAYPGE
jgi:hypothetical protein